MSEMLNSLMDNQWFVSANGDLCVLEHIDDKLMTTVIGSLAGSRPRTGSSKAKTPSCVLLNVLQPNGDNTEFMLEIDNLVTNVGSSSHVVAEVLATHSRQFTSATLSSTYLFNKLHTPIY